MNKPDIRFNGFEKEWEEKNLGKICTFSKGHGYSKNDLTSEGTPVYLYGQMYTNYKTILLQSDKFVRPQSGSVYSTGKEVILPASGETPEDIARATAVLAKGIILGGDINIVYPPKELKQEFLALSISYENNKSKLAEQAQGATISHLHGSDIAKLSIAYPSSAEQTKIGNLFSQIDSLISSTQKEHDKLVSLKKCMLQKMFPKKGCLVPEIRFKGFTGEWVETKFYNIGTVKSGYAFQSENFLNQGIPVIRITNIQDGEVSFDEIVYYSEFDIDKDFIAERGDILLAMSGATTGKTGVYKREQSSYINQRVGKFIFNDETTFKPFYKSLFDTEFFMEQVIGSVATGAQPNIGTKNVENMIFTIPIDKNEQQKIGSYFQNLDNLISKQSQELEKLQNVKKTLLSKMFV